MPDHETTTRPGPVVDLSHAELERALGRSVARGRQLVARRARRRAAAGLVGAAALLVGGFGIIESLSDDTPVVVPPAGRTGGPESGPTASTTNGSSVPATTEAVVPGAPAGFTRTDVGDGLVRIDNDTSIEDLRTPTSPSTMVGGGVVDIGTAATEVPAAEITGAVRVGDHELRVTYECDPTATHVGSVIYRLDGSVVRVQVRLEGVTSVPCSDESAVELYFPDESLPVDVRAETARFDE